MFLFKSRATSVAVITVHVEDSSYYYLSNNMAPNCLDVFRVPKGIKFGTWKYNCDYKITMERHNMHMILIPNYESIRLALSTRVYSTSVTENSDEKITSNDFFTDNGRIAPGNFSTDGGRVRLYCYSEEFGVFINSTVEEQLQWWLTFNCAYTTRPDWFDVSVTLSPPTEPTPPVCHIITDNEAVNARPALIVSPNIVVRRNGGCMVEILCTLLVRKLHGGDMAYMMKEISGAQYGDMLEHAFDAPGMLTTSNGINKVAFPLVLDGKSLTAHGLRSTWPVGTKSWASVWNIHGVFLVNWVDEEDLPVESMGAKLKAELLRIMR